MSTYYFAEVVIGLKVDPERLEKVLRYVKRIRDSMQGDMIAWLGPLGLWTEADKKNFGLHVFLQVSC